MLLPQAVSVACLNLFMKGLVISFSASISTYCTELHSHFAGTQALNSSIECGPLFCGGMGARSDLCSQGQEVTVLRSAVKLLLWGTRCSMGQVRMVGDTLMR